MNRSKKTLVLGVLLAATLLLAVSQAMAAVTAQVDAGTLKITGDSGANKLLLIGTTDTLHVDVGSDGTSDLAFDRSTFTAILVDTRSGDDEVTRVGSLAGEAVTIRGGGDDDRLIGGPEAETLVAGGGDDFVDGNQGADTAFLGSGSDRFQWDPGDGSDTVDGEYGSDVLDFNGSAASELVEVSANGSRARFTRNIGNIAMDLADVENVSYRPLGNADTTIVNDLAGTDVETVDVDLNASRRRRRRPARHGRRERNGRRRRRRVRELRCARRGRRPRGRDACSRRRGGTRQPGRGDAGRR